jgi:leucyl-tRNA synthetase
MKKYDPKKIEPKWQKYWKDNKTFEASESKTKEKFYGLIEFPYPSGEGLHVGHPRSNTAMDVISRKKRMEGKNVLFPIGFDAFGLPTENFAIKTGKPPAEVTKKNIANFTRQLKMLGFSFDWSRQVDTTDPKYYKWTQWLFLQFYKHGLAYKKNQPINWCPKDKIGLANEEVVGGCCERCGTPVEKKNKEQWMLAITKYADKLLEGLKEVNYIERARSSQENWIGKSEGVEVVFPLRMIPGQTDDKHVVTVFTTRPDTIFGVTFLAVSPELAKTWLDIGWQASPEIKKYVADALEARAPVVTREEQEKTGVSAGIVAVNPVSKEQVPVWITNYVMGGVGTGAIMGVPAHDERDFDFAKKFGLPIKNVVVQNIVVTGAAAPREGKDLTRRKVVTGIIHNSKDDSFLLLRRADHENSFVGGTIEEGEDPITALRREITEETGYLDFEIKPAAFPNFFGSGYKLRIDKNCLDFEYFYVVELNSERRQEISKEEMAKHEPFWVSRADVSKTVTLTTHQYMWKWYQEKTKYLVFDFDGVIGDTYEVCIAANMLIDNIENKEAINKIEKYNSRKPDHSKGHSLTETEVKSRLDWIARYGQEMLKSKFNLFDDFNKLIRNIPNTKIAIISAGSGLYIRNRIEETGLNPTHVLTYEDHHSKEEKIEQVCKDWGVSMQDIYYFTDTKADVYELEDCLDRKKIIGCAWGYCGYDLLREVLPENQILKQYTDIHKIFGPELFADEGISINSDFLNGLQTSEAKEKIVGWLEENKVGKRQINYKLRDWVFSRQRYWGEPIPLVFCEHCKNQKQKALLIHGFEAAGDSNWLPWMKVELEKQGYEVTVPTLPESSHPDLKKWLAALQPYFDTLGENDVLVGHSLGSKAALHLLEKSKKKIGHVYLVASAIGEIESRDWDEFTKKHPNADAAALQKFWKAKFDWKLVDKHATNKTIIISADDTTLPKGTHNNVPSSWTFKTWNGFKHFTGKQIPELLEEILRSKNTGWVPLPESELPLKLPKVEKYQPTDTGESPLAAMTKWVNTKCPNCGNPAKRETDTMPNWAGSSWYFLAYALGGEKGLKARGDKFWNQDLLKYWQPVDWYNGGMEHTVLHLLYSRFWNIFLHDIGLVPTSEPYKKRTSHGMILAKGGEKMSKSRGNVVNPDEMVEQFGADALRAYIMFMGPFDQAVEWDTNGLVGVRRFLEKVWGLHDKITKKNTEDKKIQTMLHQTIKKVTEDIEGMRFNTAISKMMELANEMSKIEQISVADYSLFIKLLSPFAPHLCEEVWSNLGHKKSIAFEEWPQYDEKLTIESEITLAVQVNGKLRDTIIVAADISEDDAKKTVLASEKIQKWLEGKEPKKIIYVKGKLISIVI